MSNAFESIQQGLIEAIEFSQRKTSEATVHQVAPLDIKAIRANVDMTLAEFVKTFDISLGTLRHWERGDRSPRGPALVLLNVLAKNPKAVMQALR